VSFLAITFCVASQRVIPKVSVDVVIDTVRKLLDTPSYETWLLRRMFRPNREEGIGGWRKLYVELHDLYSSQIRVLLRCEIKEVEMDRA
jgi:hypothetical protein